MVITLVALIMVVTAAVDFAYKLLKF